MPRTPAYSDIELESFVWNVYLRDGVTGLSRRALVRELHALAEKAGREVATGDSERLQTAVNKVKEQLRKRAAADAATSNAESVERLPEPLQRALEAMAHTAAECFIGVERKAARQTQVLLADSAHAFSEREEQLLSTIESRDEQISALQVDLETSGEDVRSCRTELASVRREFESLSHSRSADRDAYERRVEDLLSDMRGAVAARIVADERQQRLERDLEALRTNQETTISTTVSLEREARQRAEIEAVSLRQINLQLVSSLAKAEAERDLARSPANTHPPETEYESHSLD